MGDDLYFQWTPVELASKYRIDVGTDPTFTDRFQFDTCYTTQTTYTAGYLNKPRPADPCMPAPGATTYWRVQPLDNDRNPINGIISKIYMFQYNPGVVQQLSPLNGATVDVPTLSWEPQDDAVKYFVRIVGGGRTREFTTHSYSFTLTGRTQAHRRGLRMDCSGRRPGRPQVSTAPQRQPDLQGVGTVPAGGTPLTPTSANTHTPRFPALTWAPHPDATHYRIRVADAGFNFYTDLGQDFAYPAGTDLGSTYLTPGTYEWYVEAWKGTSLLATGATLSHGTFTITDLTSVGGHQIALDGGALGGSETTCSDRLPTICEKTRATPVLDWQPVQDAGFYMVYLSYDPYFTNLVYGNKADVNTLPWTQNTRWTPPKL